MCNYWAEFIKKGDPNGADADGTPMEKWEAFLEEKPAVMTFFDSPQGTGEAGRRSDGVFDGCYSTRLRGKRTERKESAWE